MALRDASRVHGAIQDVARLQGLPSDDCNILFVSSRTLYLIQNYADAEVNFLGRYAKAFDSEGRYTPVLAADAEAVFVAETANNYGLEVVDMSCEIVPILNQISISLRGQSATCDCVPNGPQPPQPPTIEGEDPPEGFTEYDPELEDRKCKIANMIVDDLLEMITLLIVNNVEEAAALGLAVMSSLFTLVIAMMAAGPLGWGLAGLGTLATIIGFFLVSTVDLDEFKTIIETNRTDLICALFGAGNNTSAFTTFRAVLAGAGASGSQLGFIDVLNMINGLTALFFKPDDPIGQELEDRLDGFTPLTSCLLCDPPFGVIWRTGTSSPHNVIEIGAYTEIHASSWDNQGDAYDDADGWNDDDDSSYPNTVFHIINPAYNTDWGNNDPLFDRYWVTVRIEFTGYNGAWRITYETGFDEQTPTRGPGYSGGYYRSGKDTSLDTWEEVVAGLWLTDEYLQITIGHGGDTNTSSGKLSFRVASMQITDDIFP